MNLTENSNHSACVPPSTTVRFAGAAFLLILSLIGTVAYALIITILINYRSHFKHPFYVLEYHLTVCDCMLLLSVYMLVIPQTAFSSVRYSPVVERIFTTFDTLSFNAIMLFTFIIAVNRVMCFFWPRGLEIFFNSISVHFVSLLPWAWGIIIALVTDLFHCPKIFDTCELVYLYVCDSPTMPPQVSLLLNILQIFGYVGPILMTIGYFAVFVRLRHLNKRMKLSDEDKLRAKLNVKLARLAEQEQKDFEREIKRLKQGTVIAAILLLECLAFWLLPGFFQSSQIVSIFISSLSILNSAINPFIYLNFNNIMRQCVRSLFNCDSSKEEIVVAPGILTPIPTTLDDDPDENKDEGGKSENKFGNFLRKFGKSFAIMAALPRRIIEISVVNIDNTSKA